MVQQSETTDVIFTLLGFMLALSILVSFSISVYFLQKSYNESMVISTRSVVLQPEIKSQENGFVTILLNDELVSVAITDDTEYVSNNKYAGRMLVDVVSYTAPDAWYMMKWKVDSLNKTKTYVLKTLYF